MTGESSLVQCVPPSVGAENRSGAADNPANFCGRSGASEEIGVDAADLLNPIQTVVLGMFERTGWADAPKLAFRLVLQIREDFAAQRRASWRVALLARFAEQRKLRRIPWPLILYPRLLRWFWAAGGIAGAGEGAGAAPADASLCRRGRWNRSIGDEAWFGRAEGCRWRWKRRGLAGTP